MEERSNFNENSRAYITMRLQSDRLYRAVYNIRWNINFIVCKQGIGNVVELDSRIIKSTVDASMIGAHIFQPGEIRFMK
jgi:hypothetical protein